MECRISSAIPISTPLLRRYTSVILIAVTSEPHILLYPAAFEFLYFAVVQIPVVLSRPKRQYIELPIDSSHAFVL